MVIVWKYFGFHMMLYIAGLQSIDQQPATKPRDIDGAIALAAASGCVTAAAARRRSIRISVFFALVGSLQLFDMIMPLTGGGPLNTTHTMVSFLYHFGVVRMKVGFGIAPSASCCSSSASTVAFSYKRIVHAQ